MSEETEKTPEAESSSSEAASSESSKAEAPPSDAAPSAEKREEPEAATPAAAGGEAAVEKAPEGAGPQVYQMAEGPAAGSQRLPFEMPRVSRRVVMLAGFWTGMAVASAGAAGGGLDLIYPRKIEGFGGIFTPGKVEDFPPGSKTRYIEGRFWVVNLTEEQGGPGLLALWQKCPHLGCTVPWKEKFIWPDPETGDDTKGWFRCPCHGSTFTHAGARVFGPSPRSMDTMKLTVDDRGNVNVDTGDITNGGTNLTDNASRAVKI